MEEKVTDPQKDRGPHLSPDCYQLAFGANRSSPR